MMKLRCTTCRLIFLLGWPSFFQVMLDAVDSPPPHCLPPSLSPRRHLRGHWSVEALGPMRRPMTKNCGHLAFSVWSEVILSWHPGPAICLWPQIPCVLWLSVLTPVSQSTNPCIRNSQYRNETANDNIQDGHHDLLRVNTVPKWVLSPFPELPDYLRLNMPTSDR